MTEYIGCKISLVSKRNIRYVGVLVEINSENSTVALEAVRSFGTEDRNNETEEFVPAADNVYDYIVFRGSDVKDLRIEETPEKAVQQPQVPNDPAILGNARPMAPSGAQHQKQPDRPSSQHAHDPMNHHEAPSGGGQAIQGAPRGFPQQPQFPYGFPPQHNQRFKPYGPPQGYPPHGYPPMQFGPPPPGWYPPPGQGFPYQGPGGPGGPPAPGGPGGVGQPYPSQFHQAPSGQLHDEHGPSPKPPAHADLSAKQKSQADVSKLKSPGETHLPPATTSTASKATRPVAPPPPTESKPQVADALAPPASSQTGPKQTDPLSKSGRIMPAVPIMSPAQKPKAPVNGPTQVNNAAATIKQTSPPPGQVSTRSLEDANADARAAVKAAMAKLPPKKASNGEAGAMDNLTTKVNEMRTNDHVRNSRQPGNGNYATGPRGGRGGPRGGRPRHTSQAQKVELPKEDYDFATANAKFNKQDLVKEALAGDSPPIRSPIDGNVSNGDIAANSRRTSDASAVIASAPSYSKTSSFFDNISSESKDREDASGKRIGGREFRNEERSKNFDTFGQGSVDNGYRGGFRGRGRGRGGFRGGRGPRNGAGGGGLRSQGGPVHTEG